MKLCAYAHTYKTGRALRSQTSFFKVYMHVWISCQFQDVEAKAICKLLSSLHTSPFPTLDLLIRMQRLRGSCVKSLPPIAHPEKVNSIHHLWILFTITVQHKQWFLRKQTGSFKGEVSHLRYSSCEMVLPTCPSVYVSAEIACLSQSSS